MKASLLLEDGTIYEGKSFGAEGTRFGEVVFNTSMTGYQEILTDPSYAGQIIVMTYPEIGNYGINADDFESFAPAARGFVVKNNCKNDSHYKSEKTLAEYLQCHGIVGIEGIDTRSLVRKIRENGAMNAIITTGEITDELKAELANYSMDENIVMSVTRQNVEHVPNSGVRMAFVDFGAKQNIINNLVEKGCDVTIFPANVTASEILDGDFDAVFLSNGPGDPKNVTYAIDTVKEIQGKLPIYGICLGYQILSIVLGAKTYKLKYGHRGGNHPVMNLLTKKVTMTSQNHSYAVDASSLPHNMVPTYINLNDNTLEGFSFPALNIEGVQFHPEAAPGPLDANKIFDEWIDQIKKEKEEKCQKMHR